ncbi:MAG: hypothetical protein Q7S21_02060 [archaeon]|nr:hypothetical protein [archaeon]
MSFLDKIFAFFSGRKEIKQAQVPKSNEELTIYEVADKPSEVEEIYSIWDYLQFIENTQAAHIKNVIGFDEWISMDEIRRRVLELFGINYKNEKSLYAYVKTLTDVGLLETVNAGGKRKWRKRVLLIKIKRLQEKKKIEETAKN